MQTGWGAKTVAQAPKFLDAVPVSRIFLMLNNPRHDPLETEAKVIAKLCAKENVYPLARDIAKHGLNPLERFALLATGKTKSGTASYTVAEGNRRICALKLLNDPELAPANLRKSFTKLSDGWAPVTTVPAAVFEDLESVELWLDRIHNGPQDGIGRKPWNSEQKQRFDGGNKNKAAQALLDYAESEKMITPEERAGKLTTVQRFVGNDIFREVIGVDQSDADDIGRTRPKTEFDILVKRFMRDLVKKTHVHSRMNKEEIILYARPLGALAGITTKRIEAESLVPAASGKGKKSRRKKPAKPEKAKHVRYEEDIFQALKNLGNEKLSSLYHSICSIELDPHTPIVAVGAWSFFETLSACAGRSEGVSFDSFLNKAKLRSYGLLGDVVSLREAMERIRSYGNTTKHHPFSATFNGDQLNNDVTSLKDVILKCIAEASTKLK